MPAGCPPLVVVQHITKEFAGNFGQYLANAAGLKLVVPQKAPQKLKKGCIYLVDDDYHVELVKMGRGGYGVMRSDAPPVMSHRPAADQLFISVSKVVAHEKILCVLLTGMGKDGANGMLEIKKNVRALTLVQDEASSVVFGMPKAAIGLGAADYQGNIEQLRRAVFHCISPNKKAS